MSEKALVDLVRNLMRPGYDAIGALIDDEREKFPRGIIIRPGHRLLPTEDWAEAIITVTGVRVRLVLLDARLARYGRMAAMGDGEER